MYGELYTFSPRSPTRRLRWAIKVVESDEGRGQIRRSVGRFSKSPEDGASTCV